MNLRPITIRETALLRRIARLERPGAGPFLGPLLALPILLLASLAGAATPVDLEIVTERGVQITAPQEWLQLLTRAGIDNVRIRGGSAHEEPTVTNTGTADRPRYRAVALLTRDERLRLPGATFARSDLARLKDYLEELTQDGAESLTAPRGRYGLTEQELEAIFKPLSRTIDFPTSKESLAGVLDRLRDATSLPIEIDPAARALLAGSAPTLAEVEGLTAGTGLAILLWNRGLILRPEQPRGQSVRLTIAKAPSDGGRISTLGDPADTAQSMWPVGWKAEGPPRELAPSLFESLNAEIDGFTLEETLGAITPRLKIPLYLDRPALAASSIDPAAIKIKLPRSRTYYKRVLDRVLAQARLGAQLRVDESGTPFLWVTR